MSTTPDNSMVAKEIMRLNAHVVEKIYYLRHVQEISPFTSIFNIRILRGVAPDGVYNFEPINQSLDLELS